MNFAKEDLKPFKEKGFNTFQNIQDYFKWTMTFMEEAKLTRNLRNLELFYVELKECLCQLGWQFQLNGIAKEE